jgi:hypothetical protein
MGQTATFPKSKDLSIWQDEQIFRIQRTYKYRWAYVSVFSLMFILLILFTLMIAYRAFVESRPSYIGGVVLFLIIDASMYFLLSEYLFRKEILTIDLQQQTVSFRTGRKKHYHFQLNEVAQWQLRGEIYQQARGKYLYTRLYLILTAPQAQVKNQQYLTLFTFHPTGISLQDTKKNRESALARGKEVCEKLNSISNIPWKWYDYQQVR